MKSIGITLFLIVGMFLAVHSTEIDSVRYLYFEDWIGECGAEKLVSYMEGITMDDPALLKVCKGPALATTVNCESMPWHKLKNFNKGKNYIESAVQSDAYKREVRFVRFTIQSNIPGLLNYDNLEEDKRFILKKLHLQSIKGNQSEMNHRIINYISHSDNLTLDEQENLKSINSKG
jgi:hypothetical protein